MHSTSSGSFTRYSTFFSFSAHRSSSAVASSRLPARLLALLPVASERRESGRPAAGTAACGVRGTGTSSGSGSEATAGGEANWPGSAATSS